MFTNREVIFGIGFVTMLGMNVALVITTTLHELRMAKADKEIQEGVQGCINILRKTED